MPRQVVVLDTNLYRAIPEKAIPKLRAAERRRAIVAMANFYTVAELAAHLADSSDKDRPHCLAGLRKLWTHTALYDGAQNYLPITGEKEELLAMSLFGRPRRDLQAAARRYGQLVAAIAGLDGPVPDQWRGDLLRFRSHAESIKREFLTHVEHAALALGHGDEKWDPLRNQPDRRSQFINAMDAGANRTGNTSHRLAPTRPCVVTLASA